MTATLTLKRQGFGIELRRGHFDAVIDGTSVGSVDWHETMDMPIEPGHHTLHIRSGRYSSPERTFDATDGETVTFQLQGANIWPLWLSSFVKPDLGISLKRLPS